MFYQLSFHLFISYLIFRLLFHKVKVIFNFLECTKQLQNFYTIFLNSFLKSSLYLNSVCCIVFASFFNFLFGGNKIYLMSFHFWMRPFYPNHPYPKIVQGNASCFFFLNAWELIKLFQNICNGHMPMFSIICFVSQVSY